MGYVAPSSKVLLLWQGVKQKRFGKGQFHMQTFVGGLLSESTFKGPVALGGNWQLGGFRVFMVEIHANK